tara:strand:+ start:413 stop:985 length:573 start_codon:yes stop_codon:yes gene_type:complete
MRISQYFIILLISINTYVLAENPPYYEQHYATKQEALAKSFSESTQFEEILVTFNQQEIETLNKKIGWKINETEFKLIKAISKENNEIGYAMVLHEKGKYHPITFLVAVTTDYKIKNIVVMIYREKIGKGVRKKRYLKQYKDKTKKDPLIVDYDIMGLSGATISSWSITAGAKKALIIIEDIITSSIIKS